MPSLPANTASRATGPRQGRQGRLRWHEWQCGFGVLQRGCGPKQVHQSEANTSWCLPHNAPNSALQFSLGAGGAAAPAAKIAAVRRGPAPTAPRAGAAAAKVPLARAAAPRAGAGSAPASRSASASLEQLEAAQQEVAALQEQVGGYGGKGSGWCTCCLDCSATAMHVVLQA